MLENLVNKNLPEEKVQSIVEKLKDIKESSNHIFELMTGKSPKLMDIYCSMFALCDSILYTENVDVKHQFTSYNDKLTFREIVSFYKSLSELDYEMIYDDATQLFLQSSCCLVSFINGMKNNIDEIRINSALREYQEGTFKLIYDIYGVCLGGYVPPKSKVKETEPENDCDKHDIQNILKGKGCVFAEDSEPYYDVDTLMYDKYIEVYRKQSQQAINTTKELAELIYQNLADTDEEKSIYFIEIMACIVAFLSFTRKIYKSDYKEAFDYNNYQYEYMTNKSIINYFETLSEKRNDKIFEFADYVFENVVNCAYSLIKNYCDDKNEVKEYFVDKIIKTLEKMSLELNKT